MRVRALPVLLLSLAVQTSADVKLPAVFGSHMVIQRGAPIPVWGWAEPGEDVTVTLAGQTTRVKTDTEGRWTVTLKPLKVGKPIEMVVTGNTGPKKPKGDIQLEENDGTTNTIKLTDILVGDVWVCSGQSNMAMSVSRCNDAEKEVAAAKFPGIRLFTVNRSVSPVPLSECQGAWAPCGPENVGGFTAAGYYFGRELHKRLGVPIGLIHTSWGGTPAEAWTDRPFLESNDDALPILARALRACELLPQATADYEKKLNVYKSVVVPKWLQDTKQAKAEGKPLPRRPRPPGAPFGPTNPHYPSGLYNAMVAPLVPFAIKGAIWYQGESNSQRAYQYRSVFPAMIQSWRAAWKQGDFPFLFVQLANFRKVAEEPGDSAWAELREAQTMTLSLPSTGMAVIIDVGEANDIHPKNKQAVGRRLAISGLKVAYGQDIVHSGPVFESVKFEGGKAVVKFTSAGGGLVARPFTDPVEANGPTLEKRFGGVAVPKADAKLFGFAVAGEDKTFVRADARIAGDTVVVSSPKVAKPVAVRYGWADNPVCNLYNQEGLPASPFRTDTWPGITIDNK